MGKIFDALRRRRSNLDEEILRLEDAYFELMARAEKSGAAVAGEEALAAVAKECAPILAKMASTPAKTFPGLRAKARIIACFEGGPDRVTEFQSGALAGDALLASLFRDLLERWPDADA